jgi:hypothetical protein
MAEGPGTAGFAVAVHEGTLPTPQALRQPWFGTDFHCGFLRMCAELLRTTFIGDRRTRALMDDYVMDDYVEVDLDRLLSGYPERVRRGVAELLCRIEDANPNAFPDPLTFREKAESLALTLCGLEAEELPRRFRVRRADPFGRIDRLRREHQGLSLREVLGDGRRADCLWLHGDAATLEDVAGRPRREIVSVPGIGPKTMAVIDVALAIEGLTYADAS